MLTTSALVGLGPGVVSSQWLIWKSEPAVPPRLHLHETSSCVLKLHGVSWEVAKAGSASTTRWPSDPKSE